MNLFLSMCQRPDSSTNGNMTSRSPSTNSSTAVRSTTHTPSKIVPSCFFPPSTAPNASFSPTPSAAWVERFFPRAIRSNKPFLTLFPLLVPFFHFFHTEPLTHIITQYLKPTQRNRLLNALHSLTPFILSANWVYACIDHYSRLPENSTSPWDALLFKPTPFPFISDMRTCVISITGFSPDSSPSRETLKSAIDAVGACYLGPLCRGVTTHLLCRCASGAKVEAAAQWGEVPLLRAEWVLTSLREGKRAEEGDFPVEREEDLISTGDEEEVSLRDDGDDDGDEVKGDGNGSDGGNEVHGERNGNGDGGDDDGNCDDDDIESDHSVVLNNPANNGPVVPENHDSTMDDRIDMVDDHHADTTSDNDRVNTNNETIHSHPNTTSDFIKEEDHIDPVNEDNPIQSINENNPVNEDNPINLVNENNPVNEDNPINLVNENNPVNEDNPINLVNENNPVNEDNPIQSINENNPVNEDNPIQSINENNPVNEDNPINLVNENNPVNPIDENTHTNTTHDQHDHSNTINENNDQHEHTHTSTDTISSTRRSEKRPTLPHVFL
ncbi:hypothetical protein WA588_003471, partial [Blastocystis sp. NMH]